MQTDDPGNGRPRPQLHRILDPSTIAIVGGSETSLYAQNSRGTLESDAEVFYVNPKYDTVFGRRCYPSLSAIPTPIDAVFSLIGAAATTNLVEEAARLGAGGVISVATGFAESGSEGLGCRIGSVPPRGRQGCRSSGPTAWDI